MSKTLRTYSRRELSIIGAILYSCEGTRLRRDRRRENETYHWVIEFTNSDPLLIKLFLQFLRDIIGVEEKRLKGQLFAYDDLDINDLKIFWSDCTKISLSNFNKAIVFKAKNGKFKPNPNGTFKVRYYSKEAFQKLNLLINNVLSSQGRGTKAA